jgi:hypothetical protein
MPEGMSSSIALAASSRSDSAAVEGRMERLTTIRSPDATSTSIRRKHSILEKVGA